MNFDWFSFISGTIAAIIGAIVGQRLTADNEAIILCRQDILELEADFKYINEHKNRSDLNSKKISIKENFQKLEMHHINLLIQHQDVQGVIDKSYEILDKNWPGDQINFWCDDILREWNCFTESNVWNEHNKFKIWKQQFFHKGFSYRLKMKILSYKISLVFCIIPCLLLFFLYGMYGKGEQCKNINQVVLISY